MSKTWYKGGPTIREPKRGVGGASICHTRKTCGTPLYRVGGPIVHEPIYLRQFVALTQDVVMQFRNVVNISHWSKLSHLWEFIRIKLTLIGQVIL